MNRLRRTVQGDGTLVAVFTTLLIDLQKERSVAKRDATIDAFSATDTPTVVDHVLEERRLNLPTANRSDRTKLVLRSGVPRNRLRIEKPRTKIAVSTHCKIMETFDRRNGQNASVSASAASDTTLGIDLPRRCVGTGFLFGGEQTRRADDSNRRRTPTDRFQEITSL